MTFGASEEKPDDVEALFKRLELRISEKSVYKNALQKIKEKFDQQASSVIDTLKELELLQTRLDTLAYKPAVEKEASKKNTLLHEVILNGDAKKAQLIIEADKKYLPIDNRTVISSISISNSPLMLALKTGMISVADALLDHPFIEKVINVPDDRGLTPLHWACALRQDGVIKKLIEHKAEPNIETRPWWLSEETLDPRDYPGISPLDLYKANVDKNCFADYVLCEEALFKDKKLYGWFPKPIKSLPDKSVTLEYPILNAFIVKEGEVYTLVSGFKEDRRAHYIPGMPAYTDLIFHIADVCVNLFGADKNKLKVKPHSIEDNSAGHRYYLQFKRSYDIFCEKRNALKVNPDIVTLLSPKLQPGKKLI